MKYIIEVKYDFYTNRVKFLKPQEVTDENEKYYICSNIGESFKKSDDGNIKQFIGNCYYGLKVWKCFEFKDQLYLSNRIASVHWGLVEEIKDYLKAQIEQIEVE